MIEIFGITFYTNFFAVILFGFIAFITTFIFLIRLPKKKIPKKQLFKKILIHLSILFVLFSWLHYDIFLAGLEISIKQYRKECGMHIYRKNVDPAGIAGLELSGTSLNRHGIPYVERKNSHGDIVRFSMVNGKEVIETVDEYTSLYIYKYKAEGISKYLAEDFITKQSYFIADRINSDVLGEIIRISVEIGWADQWVPGDVYRGFSCCKKEKREGYISYFLNVNDLIEQIFVSPKKKKNKQ